MPPDPCRELVELGACTSATACGADAWCPTGQCLPPEEIAALSVPAPALAEFGLLTSDPETHEPEASEPEVAVEGESAETEPSDTSETTETSAATAPATTTPRSGGGCCGSRGARTRATALGLLALVPLTLLRKTRGQHEFERRRRAGSEAAKRSI